MKNPHTGRNDRVELRPLNKAYPLIEIDEGDEAVNVIATLKRVLP